MTHDLKFPLSPDDYHLRHVGRTKQGNGYWITTQLSVEEGGTRDFVAAYLFDRDGALISTDIIDLGIRPPASDHPLPDTIEKLKQKLDAVGPAEIWVRPFAVSFYGLTFGLVIREAEEGDDPDGEPVVDAMPGHTLMFYAPWDRCNYDS